MFESENQVGLRREIKPDFLDIEDLGQFDLSIRKYYQKKLGMAPNREKLGIFSN